MLTIETIFLNQSIVWYCIDRTRHRFNAPAIMSKFPNGKLRLREYIEYNLSHRDPRKGPAYTHWIDSGHKMIEHYKVRGESHRPYYMGPAHIKWDANGKKTIEEYIEEGKLHRPLTYGPALILYKDGRIRQEWWYKGFVKKVTEKPYVNH